MEGFQSEAADHRWEQARILVEQRTEQGFAHAFSSVSRVICVFSVTMGDGRKKKTTVSIGGAADNVGTEVFSVEEEEVDAAGATTKSTKTLLRMNPVGLLQDIARLR